MPSRSRAAPVILVILLMAALAAIAPLLATIHTNPETWVAEVINTNKPASSNPGLKHRVWVNRRSGLYYCLQSKFYGRMHPGLVMRQGSALQEGYRPAEGQMCP